MKQYCFGGSGGCPATLSEGKTLVPVSDEREEVICHKVSQGLLTEIVVVEKAGPMWGGGGGDRGAGARE